MPLSRINNPFLSSSGSNNTSITSPAANTILFTTASTTRSRFDSQGNFSVGNFTAPQSTVVKNWSDGDYTRIGQSGSYNLNLYYSTANGRWEYAGTGHGATLVDSGSGNFSIQTTGSSGTLGASASSLAQRMIFGSDGLVTLSSGQIKFPASQNASADANTLDDYEEGTYTPSVTGSTSGGPFTFGTQSGYYTKIGREVKVSMFMSHNSTITLGGAYKISLPFAVADYAGGGFVTYFSNWIGQSPRIFQIEASTTYGYLRTFSTTEMVDMQTGHVQNNTSYMLTIIYKTT